MIVGHVLPLDLARGAQRYARTLRDALTNDADTHVIATVFNSDTQVLDADVAWESQTVLYGALGSILVLFLPFLVLSGSIRRTYWWRTVVRHSSTARSVR